MKKVILVFGLLLAVALFFLVFKKDKYTKVLGLSTTLVKSGPSITIHNQTFSLLLAKTTQEKELGLGNRKNMPLDTGMYFSFDKAGFYSFWMKGMEFPLDIIYLNGNKIVSIYSNLANPTPQNDTWQVVTPAAPSNGVLEINAGLAQKYHFQVGDDVQLSL